MGASDEWPNNNQQANVNRVWTAPNAEEVTINVVGTGTETDAIKFLDKGQSGTGYSIVANKNITIVSIKRGVDDVLKGDPIQVAADTRRTRAAKQASFTTMTINVLSAATEIQLEVF